jgi:dTDP-4-dehydrorhamnose reductase
MTNLKILITGASGYVGSRVYKDLKDAGFDVVGAFNNTKLFDDLVKVDLTDSQQVKDLIAEVNPQIIIHTAADAHTNTCEQYPDYAQKINIEATKYLVDEAKTHSIRFIHLSTFACFNENASSVYAKTKIQAEKLVETLEDYVIVRLSMVVGLSPNRTSKNFYNDLHQACNLAVPFEADSSWQFEMSYLGNVVNIIKQIISMPEIKQVMIPYVDEGVTSKYNIAKDLLGDRVKEAVSNRFIPRPELDLSVFEKYNLQRGKYEFCIEDMRRELTAL